MDVDGEHLVHKRQDLNCVFGLLTSVLLKNRLGSWAYQ